MKDKRFFLHPKPIKGELLSSWLVRIALMHRIAPVTFMNIHFPQLKPDIWSRDMDMFWGARPDLLRLLSFKSRVPFKSLFQSTLNSYSGYLNEKIHVNTRNRLIMPIVNKGRESKARGLRYCPQCLQEDSIPFFRKEWRLSFVTTCLKHHCFLEDCCPKCYTPVNIYKLVNNNNICHCYKCDNSYLGTKVKIVPQGSYGIKAQKHLLNTLNSGWFTFEGKHYYSLAYFDALKQMCKVIYSLGTRAGINEHEPYHKSYPSPMFIKTPSILIEDTPLREQYIIFSMSEYILQSIEESKIFCQRTGVGKTELTHSMKYIPYWYDLIVRKSDYTQYSISLDEAKAALHYMKKNKMPISLKALSDLVGRSIDSRKRNDIITYIKSLRTEKMSILYCMICLCYTSKSFLLKASYV